MSRRKPAVRHSDDAPRGPHNPVPPLSPKVRSAMMAKRATVEMSFLPVEDESERALEAALSFLAECERSTSWLLGSERASFSLDDGDAGDVGGDVSGDVTVDFFSATDSPGASGDAEDAHLELALASTELKTKGRRKARKHSNRARDERRQELVYLRKKVGEMEAQLAELKTHSGGATGAKRRDRCSSPPQAAAPSTALAAVWGEMAKRQYQERQMAEKENVRLKLILERQLKMAKSLEKILRNRHNNQSAQSLGLSAKRMRRLSPTDGSFGTDECAVLDMLLSGVEQAHREVDAVFEANGLGRMEKPHRNAKVEHDGVNGIVMEIYANKVMPFDMHTTGRAVWRHFAHAKYDVPHQTYYEKQPLFIETDSNTIVESYGLEQTEGHIKANFHVKHILRRYFEDDRIVIVWCTLTDTVEFRSEPTSGIRFLEKGYIIIQKPQSSSLPADCSSLLKTCYIIRPDAYGDFPDQTQKIGALTDFALSSVSGTISTSHQMIENFLLSESLKK